MNNVFKIALSFMLIALNFKILSQNSEIDSLKFALKNAKHDTTRCNILAILVEVEMDENIWPIYNSELKAIAEKNLIKNANSQLQNLYLRHLSTAINNIGFIFMNQGNIAMALNNYHDCLRIQEKINDKSGIAGSYNNLGFTYLNQGDIEKALEYYFKGLKIRYEQDDKFGIAVLLNNIGYAYQKQKKNHDAIINYEKSLTIYREIDDKKGVATELNNMGVIYGNNNDNIQALSYFELALNMRIEIGDKEGIAFTLNNMSEAHLNLGHIKSALIFAEKGYQEALGLGFPENIKLTAFRLAKIYKIQRNYQKAYEMTVLYIQMRDSINNSETKKASIKKQFQYQYEKQAAADSLKHAEEQKVKNAQLKAQSASLKQEQTQRYALYGGLVLVIAFSGFVFNRFRVTQNQKQIIELKEIETQKQNLVISHQKHLVEEKHREITDSINYAERIQRSFLATKEQLDENLKDYFVFFQPKDVVSGDFYCAHTLQNGNFALVTADSTGHGVPGAIMSLLNISSLEKAVEIGINEPAELLNYTRQTIIERLKKDGSIEGGKDGMDCSLISFNKEKTKLIYSAANNPIWIVRQNELLELKYDKMPVGRHDRDSISFSQHEIDLQKGDLIYTLTDGFPDQFGGAKGKKFMYKKLKEILVSISHLALCEQKDYLKTVLNNWMGELEQVDDVCLIGIRV